MILLLFKRFLRKSPPSEKEHKGQRLAPEQWVEQIRQGNELLREQFIAEYRPYILKVTSRFSKRYIDAARDDEYSVALQAFNEAINQYDSDAGKSFIGFAETVIRRRLIDYVRKEQRHSQVVPYSMFDSEDEEQSPYNAVETKQAMTAFESEQTVQERRMEIGELNEELVRFGITFAELVESSPKHADSRQLLIGIARVLAEDEQMLGGLRVTGKLPVKELTERCSVSRKTVERNRKYIIAVAIMLSGAYPFMHDYLQQQPNDQSDYKQEASK